ncbi:hypothetical protein V2J09_007706 [Rumex salicifolius]
MPNLFCGHDQTRFIQETGQGHRNPFPCGACRTSIVGDHFRCSVCEFSLHPLCKTRRLSLSTFLHPEHRLTLVTAATASAVPASRRCNVCFEPVRGVYYTCCKGRCDFDVHPQCSQISPRVRHVLDPHHALELQLRAPYSTRCNACGGDCAGWAYRCGVCHVDVHYWCLWKPAVVAAPQTATRQTRSPFYFGQSTNYNSSAVPYWWPGSYNMTSYHHNAAGVGVGSGSGSGSGFGSGSALAVANITGSLAVNLLSNLSSNLIQNGFLFS